MIDDGKLRLQVTLCHEEYFEARTLIGGMLFQVPRPQSSLWAWRWRWGSS